MDADRYYIIHKPYDMVSQFVSSHRVRLLGDLGFDFPAGTHPIGRLDNDSEGLLILTTDKRVTRLLFQGKVPHRRTYLVKVKYRVTEESLERLRRGVSIRVRGGGYYVTAPCEVERAAAAEIASAADIRAAMAESTAAAADIAAGGRRQAGADVGQSPGVGDGQPPGAGVGKLSLAERDYVPVTWLRMTLTEGKFHQVRKMVAAVGHRCVRLLRVSIEELTLDGLEAGDVREVAAAEFFERLKIDRAAVVAKPDRTGKPS